MSNQHVGVSGTDDLFVGRAAQLQQVTAALAGRRAVIVRGEPGCGKSTLLARALADPGDRRHVLRIQPDPLTKALPYAAIRHALTRGPHPSRTAELLASELATAMDPASASPIDGVVAASVRYADAVVARTPLVLAVDDLDQLDDAGVVLVAELLTSTRRVTLLGTRRTPVVRRPGPLNALIDRCRRAGVLDEIELPPMTDAQIAEIAALTLPGRPSSALRALVQRHSHGNPFLATKLLAALAASDAMEGDGEQCWLSQAGLTPITLNPAVQDDIISRFLPADEETLGLAQALALLGAAPLSRVDVAAELTGLPSARAEAVFDELAHRSVLVAEPGRSYRFRYWLVGEAVYQAIGPMRRLHWHQHAVRRLTALEAGDTRDRELAIHMRETATYGDLDAITILFREAERVSTTRPDMAVTWYKHALALTPAEDPVQPRLNVGLARALFRSGRIRDAIAPATSALDRLTSPDARRRMKTLVAEALCALSEIGEAADLVSAMDGPEDLARCAQAAFVYAMAGRDREAENEAARATALLPTASPAAQVNALVHLAHMHCVLPRYGDVPELLARLGDASRHAPAAVQLTAYSAIAYVLAGQGDTRRCAEAIARAETLTGASSWSLQHAGLATSRARHAAQRGDWDEALSIVHGTVVETEESGSLAYLAVLRSIEVDILTQRGAWQAARQAARPMPTTDPTYQALLAAEYAQIDMFSGDHRAAHHLLATYLAGPRLAGAARVALLARLAELQLQAGRPAEALAAAKEAHGEAGRHIDHVSSVRTLLAIGRATGDADAIRSATELAERHHLAFLLGQCHLYLGSMDVQPEQHLRTAAGVFHRLDATPWRRRAMLEMRERGLKIPRFRRPKPALLTTTEEQIAHLVQLGRANRDIAQSVSLSVKTVEAYLSRVYAKTGCTNRLELARALDRGLLSRPSP